MIVGKVVGSVVSTRKCEKLIGNKFMIIEPVHHMKGDLSQLVAIDMIGACGSGAPQGCGKTPDRPDNHTGSWPWLR